MAEEEGRIPRGRMSAYAFFVYEAKENFKKNHPDEEIVFLEFSKNCSETWSKMSESEKNKYNQIARESEERLESEEPLESEMSTSEPH